MNTIVKEDIVPSKVELSGAQRARLEERLQRARGATTRPVEASAIPRRTSQENLPLSFAQEGLWFLDQLEPGSAAYNVFQALRLRGELNLPALEKALNEIVRRHEILRTNFVAADGAGVQVIAPTRSLALTVTDLGEPAEGTAHEALQRTLREESRRPFEFTRDMLLRALLVRISANEHVLMLTMHHIISDGWSLGLLFRELAALYAAFTRDEPSPLPELPIQFADFALWERANGREAQFEKSLAYWKKQLGGTLPMLELPFDHPRSALPTSRGGMQTVELARPLGEALKTLGQQEGATLYMTLLAAFKVLLHRWTGQDDIVVGSVVAGRRKVELEKLIGFFVNTIVLRSDLAGNPTFRKLLGRVRDGAVAAMAHQDLPFERLVKELRPDRSLSRNPLFQVLFVLQNAPMAPAELPGLTLESIDVDNATTKFDLTLSMIETRQGFRAALEYNADLFEPATISRLFGCLQTLLEGIVALPDVPIDQLPLLTPAERHQLVAGWNRTWSDYPRDQTIAQLFEAQVARTPHAIALVFGGDTLSYSQLERRANQLARRLRQAGVGPDTLVGVCMDRSLDLIVALLGILKAGGAYVSLDPAYPAERLAFMLGDCRAPVLLTHAAQRATVAGVIAASPDKSPAQVIALDSDWSSIAAESEAALEPVAGPEHLAYVSYTSGSTGRPKGVCIPNRGVIRLVKNTDFARFDTDEVFLQLAPIAFDASTLEIWGALLNGARLVVHPPGLVSLAELGEAIERNGITTLWLTAGLFHQMIEEQIDRLKHVRQLLAGGDVLSVAHVTRALEHLPRTQLINGYGPTENTTFTCCHRITAAPASGRSIPIGRPIANTQVYVLDRQMQPVPMGVPGELYTGGDGLAREYLNRPALTAEKFVPHPFSTEPGARLYRTGDLARWLSDGTIEFLGRMDRQVKIRGFRVEPAEVEAILATHPAVKECAVVPQPDAAGGKVLHAYIVPKAAPAPEPEAWRTFLQDKVPEYLLPSAFLMLETLPLSANGKLDVAALPVTDGARPTLASGYVAPRDDVEKQLAEIWSNVLGVNPIGIHDRFFDLGGHSLLAVRMVAQVDRKFGKKLPVAAIFQHRTIELLARLLRTNAPRYAPVTSVVEIQGQGKRPPVYLVHGVGGGMFWGYSNLSRHMGAEHPVYGFKSRGLDGLPEWPTIEEMAANYLIDLRAQQARGPYYLGGYCFGGVVAYEMARQLHQQGEEVAFLALINCSPPNTGYEKPGNRRSLRWQLKFIRNLFYWAGCFFFRWSMRERTDFVRWKLRVLHRKASEPSTQSAAQIAQTDIDELLNLADYSDRQRELWQEHVRALFNYHPKPYAGRVTLFRTGGHPLLSSFDEQFGWGELAQGGVEVRLMPGGHGNILDEPHVRVVAQSFQASLRKLAP
jgi:amino acid adenylation domain-containing protein